MSVNVVPRLTVNTVDFAIDAAESGLGLANVLCYQCRPRPLPSAG